MKLFFWILSGIFVFSPMHLLTTHLLTEFSYQSTGLKNVCARLPNSYVLCLREEVASLMSQNLLLSHDLFFPLWFLLRKKLKITLNYILLARTFSSSTLQAKFSFFHAKYFSNCLRWTAQARALSSLRQTSRFFSAFSTASCGRPTFGSFIRRPSGSLEEAR